MPNESNCDLCDQLDSNQMVQCDTCDKWLHYKCANVTAAIVNLPFECKKCKKIAYDNEKLRLEQEQRKLEQVRAEKMRVEEEEKQEQQRLRLIEQQRIQREQDELKQMLLQNEIELRKNELLMNSEVVESSSGIGTNNVTALNKSKGQESAAPGNKSSINNNDMSIHNTKAKSHSSKASSKRTKNIKLLKLLEEQRTKVESDRKRQAEEDRIYYEQKKEIINEMNDSDSDDESLYEIDPKQSIIESCSKWAKDQQQIKNTFSTTQRIMNANTGAIPKHQSSSNQPTVALPASQPLLSLSNQRQFLNSTNIKSSGIELINSGFKDSIKRIAAHHLYDLPKFNGCPSDWPMFMSTYMRSTVSLRLTNSDNLSRLQKCLEGEALKLVRNYLVYEESVPRAIDALRIRFGRPELVLEQMINQVRGLPKINTEKLETILDLSMAVQHLCLTMEAAGMSDHLNNPMLLQELVDKLPGIQKIEWASYKYSLPNVNLSHFDSWLYELSDKVSTIMPVKASMSSKLEEKSIKKVDKRKDSFHAIHSDANATHEDSDDSEKDELYNHNVNEGDKCCICGEYHDVSKCRLFIKKDVAHRWNDIKSHDLCRKCLCKHSSKTCRSKEICNVNGCPYKHHKLLHDPVKHSESSRKFNNQTKPEKDMIAFHSTTMKLLFRVVPVVIYGPFSSLQTFAFLDEGSTRTLIDDEIAQQLQLEGSIEPLHLKWSNDMERIEMKSRRISFDISGNYKGTGKKFRMSNVRTVSNLDLVNQSFLFDPNTTQYQHLKNIPMSSYQQAKPKILIGMEHWHLALPLEVREGNHGEPVATKTRLGWTVLGPYVNSNNEYNQHHYQISECNSDENLHTSVKEFFSMENFGVKVPEVELESRDDQRARILLKQTTKKLNNSYETGLLWKYDHVVLPDSYPMAMKRLQCLEKRIAKSPILASKIKELMHDYVIKGYARKLCTAEINQTTPRTWYLPIFTVTNINKPDKVRVVWDAAATVNNTSLNSMLIKGPDFLCALPNILYRFREQKIALAGDIKEMYHQVMIRDEDKNSQRFLWRDDPNAPPSVFVMNVMTFGATCSPCSAHYVKNTNAMQYNDECPRAVTAICQNHYVDDWLDSFSTEEEACLVVKDVIRIHRIAGFTIRNWVSNSSYILEQLGVVKENQTKDFIVNDNSNATGAKVLGMWWDTQQDSFHYLLDFSRLDVNIINGTRQPTKREVLRTLMMVFDPLGLVAWYLVYLKILLQDIWRSSISWDQHISKVHQSMWVKWIRILPSVQQIKIPRCYLGTNYKSLQLHVFVDASATAFAATAYFRFETSSGIRCSLVAAKTKVAPLKILSIPRLELQAAVLGTRLSNSICSAHTMKPDRTIYWSDSVDVLAWLRSDHRKYRQYVAFRVGEILETTNLNDWRWVPTRLNVADDATKWKDNPKITSESRWYTGPNFLYSSEHEWPKEKHRIIRTTEEEALPHLSHVSIEFQTNWVSLLIDKLSNWRKAYRTVAWVLRFLQNSQTNNQKEINAVLTSYEVKRAKSTIFRQAQLDEYSNEIAILEKNPDNSVDKTSKLYKQSPFIDEFKVLRVRGRTGNATNISPNVVNPIILPKNHRVSHLVVVHYHEKFLHRLREAVINEVRQLYSIPQLRALLKKICSNCQVCKNEKTLPMPPQMADHPKARLAVGARPFSYVGIDYFGPLEVVVGRHVEKRWGCLFTCLTIRAIHIEIAHSLSKESCLMCIRNFIARRGMPLEIRTDNGTNFIGVRNELQKLVHKIPLEEIKSHFDEIKWKLNPPLTPHMGGCWERLVRTVKKCLESKMPTRRPDDENLRCYLLEVESMINSRPLTYIPIGPDEPESLTPNHFLLGSSGGMKPFCEFDDDVYTVKRNYKLSQQMALHFWKRWLHEYLPTLTRRTKWFEKIKQIEVGDVVVIMDEGKRNSWMKGIITETIIGRNSDQVRQVVVKTKNGTYVRPAIKVAVLDVRSEDDTKPKHLCLQDVSTYLGGACCEEN